MEKLNLNEEQSIKFFYRYAEHEGFILKAKFELDQSIDMLDQGVESGKGDNEKAIRKVFRYTVSIAKHFDLIGGKLVAGDSTKLRAQNSKKNNFTPKK